MILPHRALAVVFMMLAFVTVRAQETGNESPPNEPPYTNSELNLDQEFNAAKDGDPSEDIEPQGQVEKPVVETKPPSSAKSRQKVATPDRVRTNITDDNEKLEPQFVKPPGPKRGGVLRVPHPNAGKGLLRINKDGTYQYKVSIRPKSKSGSLRMGRMTPPKISGGASAAGTLDYKTMYGSDNLISLIGEYEWQPFTSFGRLGLNLGGGFATARGNGYFKTVSSDRESTKAEETYSLYIFPLSAFLSYRFEYARRQWVVPFINGGVTYYGMMELRDDNKYTFAGASAVGGGGGLMFSISAWDQAAAFRLDREYGIADMYFVVEARAMQGLSTETDFSTQTINGGITIDF